MKTSFAIRKAVPSDLGSILDLQRTLFLHEPVQPSDSEFEALIVGRSSWITVVEMGGGVVGYTLVRDRPFRPWSAIDIIGVSTEYAGAGLGEALVSHVLAHARRPLVRLFVRASNLAARRLYQKTGFFQVGRRVANYGDGEDALVFMRLRKKRH